MEQIDKAAEWIAQAIAEKRSVFGFASMHAGIVIEPVYRSGNLDGGPDFNARIIEKYKDVIHYL